MGIRLNYRVGRFVKSYASALPWRDDLYYQQTQAYWVLANWRLQDLTGDERFGRLACAATDGVLARQRPDGAWEYPNPEWRGRVATTEGTWAAVALLATGRRTGGEAYLEGALTWHRFLEEEIGYETVPGGLAFRYFADRQGASVPNNSADVLRLLAELADVTGEDRYLERAEGLLGFLAAVQRPDGELPYQVSSDGSPVRLPHFQCPQYNAFECLDLLRFRELTGDRRADPLIAGMLGLLRNKVGEDGRVPYACHRQHPRVTYHLGAVAAALQEGVRWGEEACAEPAVRALPRLVALQRADGTFPHSRQDYGFLRDDRAYPRTLAMILFHLLVLQH